MSLPVVMRRNARRDLEDAVQWYERESLGLGARFIDAFEAAVTRIGAWPHAYSSVLGDVRRASLRHFPYSLYYLPERDRVVILRLLHQHRDPRRWPNG